MSATPTPTKVALVATLALTGAALAAFLAEAGGRPVDPRAAAAVLCLLSALFLLRVVGQLVVLARAPGWLPPMRDWNLLPYRLLLPIQVVFLVVMALVGYDLFRGDGLFATPEPAFGRAAVWFSYAYAGAMAVRYAVRMTRRPGERWFGGAIPIVFHVVLAAFVFAFGTYHVSH